MLETTDLAEQVTDLYIKWKKRRSKTEWTMERQKAEQLDVHSESGEKEEETKEGNGRELHINDYFCWYVIRMYRSKQLIYAYCILKVLLKRIFLLL